MGSGKRSAVRRARVGALALVCASLAPVAPARDFGTVSLLDGERTGVLGSSQFLNNWGGGFLNGSVNLVTRDTSVVHTGTGSIRADLGTIAAGGSKFFQTFSSELGGQSVRQTRDLTRYDSFETYVRNGTGTPLTLKYELKDYRDDNAQRATYTFSIPAGTGWTKVTAPLDTSAPGWVVDGSPDLSRTYATSFLVGPQAGSAAGSIYLDDFAFHESAGSLDVATAPISALAERLAERQFRGLWDGRNRISGLVYNSSDDIGAAAMNTTGGVMWMLPSAVRRGWVSQADADAMVTQVAASLNANLNAGTAATRYVPTRFLNPVSGGRPGGDNEESSIDASFVLLGLHQYKSRPETSPALAATIDAVENRFRLDAFANSAGFRLAYFPASGFTTGTYDGYTNEGKTISLAAEVSDAHHVPLESRWNADTFRSRVFLVNADDAHLAHTFDQFRAPFEQALINLFVDTSERGVDNYPVRSLATNPWENFVRYERETAAKLEQLGRDGLFQPDAGQGGTGGYQQYSMYNNFGQANLFMPWSSTLALLAGAPGSEEAFRTLLDTDVLNGPLGLADSARWNTGAAGPTNVPAGQDNWNMVLSTMALLEYLDGPESASRFFASLPGVSGALDKVFLDGDVTGNGVTNAADLSSILGGFGDLAGATPAGGDADGDGVVDGADLLRWQRGFVAAGAATAGSSVPEPTGWGVFLSLLLGEGLFKHFRSGAWAGPVPPWKQFSSEGRKSRLKALARRVTVFTISLSSLSHHFSPDHSARGAAPCPRNFLGRRFQKTVRANRKRSAPCVKQAAACGIPENLGDGRTDARNWEFGESS